MAGFDPSDIRSEMAAAGVGQGVPTPPNSPPSTYAIIPVSGEPVPLEIIAPGEPGNEIDVDNPPNFTELNRVDPLPPLRRLSKRQAGVDPDCNPTKKYKKGGEPSRPPFILDPDFSSDDESDDDFELVARPNKVTTAVETEGSSKTVEDVDPELDISLASFLLDLKKGKAKVTTTTAVIDEQEQGHDKEMEEEFAIGKQHATYGSTTESDNSHSSSSEFQAKEASIDTEPSDSSGDEMEPDVTSGVAASVDNTSVNTADYDLSQAVSSKFYSDSALCLWPIYTAREFIREKRIDMESYERQNVIALLKERNLLSTVTTAMPFCKQSVLEFYCNLTAEVGSADSGKFGKIFVRNHVYDFTPSVINAYFHTANTEADPVTELNIDEATAVITGGVVTKYPSIPHRLAAASLTSLYSVLHKIAIWNWTPSTNSTNVTRPQTIALFAIGEGKHFNFGRLVFNTVLAFADGGLKSTRLPFPSLIFSILESQGFCLRSDDVLTGEADVLKLAPALLKGNRKIDLPWSAPDVVPSVTYMAHDTATSSTQVPKESSSSEQRSASINVPTDFLITQLEFAMQQIDYYTEQVALINKLLEAAGPSGQQGGV